MCVPNSIEGRGGGVCGGGGDGGEGVPIILIRLKGVGVEGAEGGGRDGPPFMSPDHKEGVCVFFLLERFNYM